MLKKIFKPKIGNGSASAKLDQRLVFGLSSKRLPSFSQIKLLPKFLSKGEKKSIKILGAIILLCLILLGTNFYFTHATLVPAVGGSYVEGLVGVPKYINPLLASYNDVDRDLASLIFNGLLKTNSEGILEPDLAESYQVSPDRKAYTFIIKDGIKWHDGELLTIDDVIFTVASIQDPEWQTQLKSSLGNVQIEKIDEKTVRFSLPEPVNNFLNSLTFGILPEHKWSAIPVANAALAELNKKPIGTGPFKFNSLTKDKNGNIRTLILERNEDYFAKPAYLKEITFKFYGDFESATTALSNKNIQGLSLLPKEYREKVEKNNDLKFYELSLPQYTAIFFNTKKNNILKEVKVRQALAYGINRALVLAQALDNQGVIINGPILPGFVGYHLDIKKYDFDQAAAEKLLDEAGWKAETDPVTGKKTRKNKDEILQLTLTTVDKVEYVKTLEIIKGNWETIGVATNINVIGTDKIRTDVIEPRNYDALLFGEIIKPDPYPFWHSSQVDNPGTNLAIWANREIDTLLEEARSSDNSEDINNKYVRFQDILAEYVPAIFLYNPIHLYPTDKKIKNINLTRINVPSDRFVNIADWYIKTKSKFDWKK